MSSIDLDRFGDHLQKMSRDVAASDFSEVLATDVRRELLESIDQNFATAADAQGNAWPARKIEGDGHPLLIESGALERAATGQGAGHITDIEPNQIIVGVDKSVEMGGIPGAGVHQYGYSPRNIPARPYLEPREDALERVFELITDFGLGILERA